MLHYLLLDEEVVLKFVFESVSAETKFGRYFIMFGRAIDIHICLKFEF
ncbi:MAG: hypothetical protein ABI262_23565 [Microcoleus sp.]